MSTNYYKKHKSNQPTVLEAIVIGIGRGLWWLVSLPFRKRGIKAGLTVSDRNHIIRKRQEIESLLNSDSIIELKHAVLEADKLIDFILKKKSYKGETFADRLRSAEPNIHHDIYQNIWNGHKIRNMIAHDNGNIEKSTLIFASNNLLSYIRGQNG
jgi:hypothetical protein